MTRRPALLACVLAGAIALLSPAAASAGVNQLSVMQDDDNLLYGTDLQRDSTLDLMKAAGVDVVRATVLWKVLAPRRLRPGFEARNPAAYSSAIWNRYDRLVASARARGIGTYFDVTWPGPMWAHTATSDRRLTRLGTFRPKRREFGKFVEALGSRYSGTYRDENDGMKTLPRVQIWSLGNEPNQGGWLTPQWVQAPGSGAPMVPEAPRLYRELFYSGRRALKKTGHDADAIMFGELAPIGRSDRTKTSPIPPARFLREMFCLDDRGHRYTGKSAKLRGCAGTDLRPVRATILGYHPYTSNRAPELRPQHRDEFNLANIKALPTLLDRIAKRTHKLAPGVRIWLTEFGYETKPPDPFHGIDLAKQAEWMNTGDFLAYRSGRVDAQTQFLLRDAPPFRRFKPNSKPYWLSYQSGLIFQNGALKPAWYAYVMPIHLQPVGANVNVWGQLRFLPNASLQSVEVQFAPQTNPGGYLPLRTVTVTNPLGFFEQQFAVPATGFFRTAWRDAAGAYRAYSRPAFVKKL